MFHFLLGCFHFISFFFAHHYISHPTYHHFKFTPPVAQATVTPTPSISSGPTATPSPVLTEAPSITPSVTPSVTITPTATPSDTPTPTIEVTPTATPTAEPSPTITMTPTPTASPTPTPTPTPTVNPTDIPTMTPIETPTVSPTPTIEVTPTATPTAEPSPTITMTPTPTASPTPTLLPTPTASVSPTPTLSISSGPTADPTATASPTPTVDPAATPTATPSPTPTVTPVGNDISYPQCNNSFPSGQGFGVVGINGGLASTTNPCLSTELLWAGQSLGTANQAKVQVYVNTGNPEDFISSISTWPQNNIDPSGNTAPNPYGTCDGSVSSACAWQYGWNRAVDDVKNRFIPAAQAAGVDAIPSDYPLWLDVETTNSWSGTALDRNRIDLEAMVSYFQSQGIKVGIYSTNYQWGQIVGSVPSGSDLNGLPNWRPGASDLTGAQSNCSLSSLTSGGSISLTQYTLNNFDYDYSCL